MSTGTVTLHSWNDGNDDDEAEPDMGTNYNARLDVRDDYNKARDSRRSREGGVGLRSRIVRPRRLGDEDNGDEDGAGGGGW
jgi:WD repeat-containing protein 23